MAVSQTIATIPQAPSRADPANFVKRHEAVLNRLETLPGEMNTWKNQVNSTQTAINASELQADQSATTATNAASLALSYSNAKQYAGGTTYAPGEIVIGSNGTAYRRLNTSAAGDDPVTSSTGNWTPAITALGAMSTFDLICRIAGMQPTLYLNAKEQDYRIYSPATGLTRKALTDIVTTTRASDGAIWTPTSKLVQLTDDAPRVTFDPATGVGEGLLVEEARTNLLTYSEQFSGGGWTVQGGVLSDEDVGRKLASNIDGVIKLELSHGISPPEGQYSFTIVAEPRELHYVMVRLSSAGVTDVRVNVNLLDFSLNTNIPVDVFIRNVGKDKVEIQIHNVYLPDASSFVQIYARATNSTFTSATDTLEIGDGLVLHRAQLEAGSFPTSYIPTTTAAATRAADAIKIDGTAFSDFFNPNEFTVVTSVKTIDSENIPAANSRRHLFVLRNDSNNNPRIFVFEQLNWIHAIFARDGSELSLVNLGPLTENVTVALSYTEAQLDISVNGAAIISTDYFSGETDSFTNLYLGHQYGSRYLNSTIKHIDAYAKALPSATLQQLSALVI